MIISCINCNKKFEVNSDLITEKGRLLQCSSCNHQWFFQKEILENIIETKNSNNVVNPQIFSTQEDKNETYEINNLSTSNKTKEKTIDNTKIIIKKKSKLLSFTLIFIISFTAFIILIDTFKYPISKLIPNIEFILYNLYESINDMILFIKDLI
jgi:predicted Zn finger-like uncharacterized protein|tara:strand:- start:554 stop:1015 length:462 start_codon:yes stop_codon:yes gene_type:complete